MRTRFFAYLQMALAMSLAGSSVVVGKIISAKMPVFLISGISLLLSLLFLIPFAWRQLTGIRSLSPRNLGIIFMQALTGTVLFRILMLYGIRLTSASAGGLITSSGPAVLAILAFCFLKERPTWNKVLGIFLTVTGLFIINLQDVDHTGYHHAWLGSLLISAAVLGEALFSILQKKMTQAVSPLASTTLISFFAFICFLPLAAKDALGYPFHLLTAKDYFALVYYGIMVTSVAFILWFSGLNKVPASTAAVFTSFMPISSLALACIFLKEPLQWIHFISLSLIVAGILAMTWIQPEKSVQLELDTNHS
ncbi:MAG TPA: DMT family transporter [Bacillota bacterium]|nr:DMT family transporter [Bacillota bacterium]